MSEDQAELERWEGLARELGFCDFLSSADGFRRCADQRAWSNARRPGIYFWLAADGQAYVGQSVRPRSRLHQHMRAHGDLLRAAFQPCPLDELDALEANLVERAGEHFPLRNIKLAVSTAREVPFDLLVTREEQETFLSGGELPASPWRPLDQLERLQQRKFERLVEHPLGPTVIRAARFFIARAIPKPADTEVGFWSASLLTAKHLIRVNVGQQEVFTVDDGKHGGFVRVLTADRVNWLRSWRSPYQTRSFETRLSGEKLSEWLAGARLLSCRRLIVQLMRHTQALNSQSHCPQLLRESCWTDGGTYSELPPD